MAPVFEEDRKLPLSMLQKRRIGRLSMQSASLTRLHILRHYMETADEIACLANIRRSARESAASYREEEKRASDFSCGAIKPPVLRNVSQDQTFSWDLEPKSTPTITNDVPEPEPTPAPEPEPEPVSQPELEVASKDPIEELFPPVSDSPAKEDSPQKDAPEEVVTQLESGSASETKPAPQEEVTPQVEVAPQEEVAPKEDSAPQAAAIDKNTEPAPPTEAQPAAEPQSAEVTAAEPEEKPPADPKTAEPAVEEKSEPVTKTEEKPVAAPTSVEPKETKANEPAPQEAPKKDKPWMKKPGSGPGKKTFTPGPKPGLKKVGGFPRR